MSFGKTKKDDKDKRSLKKNYAIGVDLGGTFIKSAIVDSSAKLYQHLKIESYAQKSPEKVINQISKCIEHLLSISNKKITGIGVGAPGIVKDGIVKYPPNFSGWKIVNLKKSLEQLFSLPIRVDNDANCAALAELHFGAGRKFENFLFLTLGTGIGGGIIIDGNLFKGEKSGAGEFGMMSINFNGPECLGGNPGAVESYIGRNYFLKNEKKLIDKLGKAIDFPDLEKLAAKKNKIALELFRKYGFYLGIGITNYFNLMDCRTAILSGGISNAYQFFIKECNRIIRERALKTINGNFRVLKSSINNDAGVLGAASLFLK